MNDIQRSNPDPMLFYRALSDETRQEVMKLCCCAWISVGEIADRLHVTQPTVSHHLAVLREAGLVRVKKEGRQSFYSLNQEHIAVCCGNLMTNYAPNIPFNAEELE
jgi:ArsR family transcriptional regulator, arsenate/arsenite/antimonite-responsive transcriptional repressor